MTEGHLLVMGSGDRALREYALSAMSRRAPLALLGYRRPTWEKPYVRAYACVDLQDPAHVAAAAAELDPIGVVTYDERLVEATAAVAALLGLRGPSAEAIRRCKDKSELRGRLAAAGLSPVGFGVAGDAEEALAHAHRIGWPVVLKPRALSGSIGVVRVDDETALRERFAGAADARAGMLRSAHPGVLVEEYLDGPEFSVDAVTQFGRTVPVVTAEKLLGCAPHFEELGHVVGVGTAFGLDEAFELVAQAHRVAGLDDVVTHTEFRLTAAGPRIIELNTRLGGDLIPYLGALALDADRPGCVADVAMGRPADTTVRAHGAAAVVMLYPDVDQEVESVELQMDPVPDWLDRFEALARRGEVLRLPPRGFLSRLAVAVVRGADRDECLARVDEVRRHCVVRGTPV